MGRFDLHDACMAGDVEKVKSILEATPDKVNARGPKNRSPLHCAAKGDSPEVASLLISMGADTEARTAYKMTPLHVAAFYGSAAVIRYLLDEVKDLDINALDFGSWTSLHYACNYNRGECADLLIDSGASLTKKSAELQLVALHLAARSGNLATVEKLIKNGCNASQRNLFYTTPLHLACQNDHVDVVRFLLKSGASPDAPDEAGITPAQLTKRDDISQTLEEAVKAAVERRRSPPPPPAA
ncbi:ankyrin repeat domain protein [Ectocarpus siliculosus]|uniref:Ankyrin repeat domain protein n=1 Tax=Ectocarpus siliculosus TaxID=2880 RepID=D7FHX1_ECTSI|nr:ankyrin repeat domain protein [Ectocarpus siliculosus]|eukprot:CBJ48982.1 ankyrin repeat domain protein [Ectocarpus siliculosus]